MMRSETEWNLAYVGAAGLRLRVGRYGTGRLWLLIPGIGAHLEMLGSVRRPRRGPRAHRFRSTRGRALATTSPPAEHARPRSCRGGSAGRARLERVDVLGYSFRALAQEFAWRGRIGFAGLCWCTGPGLGGSPPRPLAALMLATPARYYHPRLLALTVPHIAGGRTAGSRSCSLSRRRRV
jgi:hypothetical protein